MGTVVRPKGRSKQIKTSPWRGGYFPGASKTVFGCLVSRKGFDRVREHPGTQVRVERGGLAAGRIDGAEVYMHKIRLAPRHHSSPQPNLRSSTTESPPLFLPPVSRNTLSSHKPCTPSPLRQSESCETCRPNSCFPGNSPGCTGGAIPPRSLPVRLRFGPCPVPRACVHPSLQLASSTGTRRARLSHRCVRRRSGLSHEAHRKSAARKRLRRARAAPPRPPPS